MTTEEIIDAVYAHEIGTATKEQSAMATAQQVGIAIVKGWEGRAARVRRFIADELSEAAELLSCDPRDVQATLEQSRNELASLREQITEAQAMLQSLHAQANGKHNRIRKIKGEVDRLEERKNHLGELCYQIDAARREWGDTLGMPTPPQPSVTPSKEPTLPFVSGIYFIWHKGAIVYVGKSVNLANRVKLSHDNIQPGDMVSWLVFPDVQLEAVECFYIWRYRPCRNGQCKEKC